MQAGRIRAASLAIDSPLATSDPALPKSCDPKAAKSARSQTARANGPRHHHLLVAGGTAN
jgi:hypothetical protein